MTNASSANSRPFRGRTSTRFWQWRPIDRNDRARIMYLAERLNTNTRRPGEHGGCLKDSGLQVLRALLFQYLDPKTGRLDPSLDTLATHTGHCKATIVAALKRLRAAGFVTWAQRVALVRIGGEMRPQQVTNSYRIGTGNAPAGFMPSGWKTYEAKSWSESTDLYYFHQPAKPADEGLCAALKSLAERLGWSKERLQDYGFA